VHIPDKPFAGDAAALAWMRETFAEARVRRARFVVIAFHARRDAWLLALGEEAARFDGRVLIVHGDEHVFGVEHMTSNLTRMEVPGSPDVGWVRVIVDPYGPTPFEFEKHVVPSWKYW
jgi:hypothetical protein